MEDAEETEAGNEQGDDGENSSQAGNASPHKDKEFCGKVAKSFLQSWQLSVKPRRAEEADWT